MPPDLGTAYTRTFNGTPPHISQLDLQLWYHYWPTIRDAITHIYFDVGLGPGRQAPEGVAPELAAAWKRINQKRADVVAEYPDHWQLIELRSTAQLNAVGRLLGYQLLWKADPPDDRPLRVSLITNVYDQDVEALSAAHGIEYRADY